MIDRLQAMTRGEIQTTALSSMLGGKLTELEDGRTVVEFVAGPQHANPMGTLHGGIVCVVADEAMGIAYLSSLEEGESFTTLELKINYLRPVWSGKLKAEAKLIKRGRTIGLVVCEVTDEGGNLVAYSTSTCMTLRGEQAQGR